MPLVVITGATRWIGRAAAMELAKRGWVAAMGGEKERVHVLGRGTRQGRAFERHRPLVADERRVDRQQRRIRRASVSYGAVASERRAEAPPPRPPRAWSPHQPGSQAGPGGAERTQTLTCWDTGIEISNQRGRGEVSRRNSQAGPIRMYRTPARRLLVVFRRAGAAGVAGLTSLAPPATPRRLRPDRQWRWPTGSLTFRAGARRESLRPSPVGEPGPRPGQVRPED